MSENVSRVDYGELKNFVERWESMEREKEDIAEMMRALSSEIKSKGYDIKIFKKIIKMRKMDPDKREEERILTDVYSKAIGL